jgi:hypothetical protein
MKEMESLEQAMSEWRPRPPSERVAERLFGRGETSKPVPARSGGSALRRAEFWSWLTPAVACALTILLGVGGTLHRAGAWAGRSGPMVFAGMLINPSSSNAPQMVELTALDENVQWNAYPAMALLAEKRSGGMENGRSGATNQSGTF